MRDLPFCRPLLWLARNTPKNGNFSWKIARHYHRHIGIPSSGEYSMPFRNWTSRWHCKGFPFPALYFPASHNFWRKTANNPNAYRGKFINSCIIIMNVFLIKKRWHCIKIYFYSKQKTNESVWAMKKKLQTIVFAAVLVFCSFSAWSAEDPCDPTPPEPPDPNPSDCMPIELGE